MPSRLILGQSHGNTYFLFLFFIFLFSFFFPYTTWAWPPAKYGWSETTGPSSPQEQAARDDTLHGLSPPLACRFSTCLCAGSARLLSVRANSGIASGTKHYENLNWGTISRHVWPSVMFVGGIAGLSIIYFALFACNVNATVARGGTTLTDGQAEDHAPLGASCASFQLCTAPIIYGMTRASPVPRSFLPPSLSPLSSGPHLSCPGQQQAVCP